jgi:hypothetical protein
MEVIMLTLERFEAQLEILELLTGDGSLDCNLFGARKRPHEMFITLWIFGVKSVAEARIVPPP